MRERVERYHPQVIAFLPVLLTAGWVALLIATPTLPGWAGAVVYGVGSFICHQLPERSFHLAGFQLPVCARCLGIYIGVSGGVAYVVDAAQSRRRPRCRCRRGSSRWAGGRGRRSDAVDGRARDGGSVVSLEPHARPRGSATRRSLSVSW